jgi:hypothetical protein
MPVPVSMLTRCVVVAGAAVVEQSAREKKQAQLALSEGTRPRLKNELMHITSAGAIFQDVRRPSWKNEPPSFKIVSAILSAQGLRVCLTGRNPIGRM